MTKLIEKVVTADPVARRIARAAKVDARLGELAASVAVDDGVSVPAAPLFPYANSFGRILELTWSPPATSDHVANARVWVGWAGVGVTPSVTAPVDNNSLPTITGVGSTSFTQDTTNTDLSTVNFTPGVIARSFVQFKNMWGRYGPWADVGVETILGTTLSVPADAINLGAVTFTNQLFANYIGSGVISASTYISLGTVPGGATPVLQAIQAWDTTVSSTAPTTFLDSTGLNLKPTGGPFTAVAASKGAKITNDTATPWAAEGFFTQGAGLGNTRGIQAKATGLVSGADATSIDPRIRLIAVADDTTGQDTNANNFGAVLDLRDDSFVSAASTAVLKGDKVTLDGRDVTGNGGVRAVGGFNCDGLIVTGGWSATFSGAINNGSVNTGTLTPGTGFANTAGQPMIATRMGDFVSLQGEPTNNSGGTTTTANLFSTLPAAYRPATARTFLVPATVSGAWSTWNIIVIGTDGTMHSRAGAANQLAASQQVSLDGVSFTIT